MKKYNLEVECIDRKNHTIVRKVIAENLSSHDVAEIRRINRTIKLYRIEVKQ